MIAWVYCSPAEGGFQKEIRATWKLGVDILVVCIAGGIVLGACKASERGTSAANADEIKKSRPERGYQRELEEIRRNGLVERANSDFHHELTNAMVQSRKIRYLANTSVVWCTFEYSLPGIGKTRLRDFGYAKENGTNWTLVWGNDREK
jgi:hypothetical protein